MEYNGEVSLDSLRRYRGKRHFEATPEPAGDPGAPESVWLDGHKLKGGWSFTRTGQDSDQWIMVKRRDERADLSLDIEISAPGIGPIRPCPRGGVRRS